MSSRSRSDGDPLRPDDHVDAPTSSAGEAAALPTLGPLGWVRWGWRQLTSMRTALVLLLLLAIAAVPGSLVPQRSSDPNGVLQFEQRDPELFRTLDALGLFSTFSSPWFSAIYLLLFVSLVGCIVPRTKHHLDALRARPPKTPMRLQRLVGFQTAPTSADAATAIESARTLLRRSGYRVETYGDSASAERGYLRETGNLVFHSALVGMLVTVGIGGGFGYSGQRVLVEGEPFANVLASYDSFSPGRFFDESMLEPYSLRLDEFEARYQFDVASAAWHPQDYVATVSTRTAGGDWDERELRVNEPLSVGGTEVYLLGNGYAPVLTVRDADGAEVFSGAVPFLQLDANLWSRGVVKVPDGLAEQVAFQGFFYPDPIALADGTYQSFSPVDHGDSLVTLFMWAGDLGLDEGVGVNAYTLDPTGMQQLVGGDTDVPALELGLGDVADLPDGLGTIEYEGLRRYVSVEVHRDVTPGWALLFAVSILGGLLVSLFVPRRRVWVKAVEDAGGTRLEYAGLARGEDPALPDAVADLARRHRESLGDAEPRMDA